MDDPVSTSTPPHADAPEPSVGIFWRVASTLVVDRTPLSRAEPYGDCLTHGTGHYELWEAWRQLGPRRLRDLGYPAAILNTEYDDWPRGRVVHEVPSRQFVLYADRRLQQRVTVDALRAAFGLREVTVVVRDDLHYR